VLAHILGNKALLLAVAGIGLTLLRDRRRR
jgi:hypothetical protein